MICLGRSNYFRFNHPAEAQRMKDALPKSKQRLSVLPIGFIPGKHDTFYHRISTTMFATNVHECSC